MFINRKLPIDANQKAFEKLWFAVALLCEEIG
jgi:hypothetical protein